MQLDNLPPCAGAKFSIEVGKRLIHQKGTWLADQGAAQCHALALAARKFGGAAVQEVTQTQHFRRLLHLSVDCAAALGMGGHQVAQQRHPLQA